MSVFLPSRKLASHLSKLLMSLSSLFNRLLCKWLYTKPSIQTSSHCSYSQQLGCQTGSIKGQCDCWSFLQPTQEVKWSAVELRPANEQCNSYYSNGRECLIENSKEKYNNKIYNIQSILWCICDLYFLYNWGHYSYVSGLININKQYSAGLFLR